MKILFIYGFRCTDEERERELKKWNQTLPKQRRRRRTSYFIHRLKKISATRTMTRMPMSPVARDDARHDVSNRQFITCLKERGEPYKVLRETNWNRLDMTSQCPSRHCTTPSQSTYAHQGQPWKHGNADDWVTVERDTILKNHGQLTSSLCALVRANAWSVKQLSKRGRTARRRRRPVEGLSLVN